MGDSDKDPPRGESAEDNDSRDEQLYAKLEILKSKLEIYIKVPNTEPVDCIFIAVHGMGINETMLENDYKSLKHSLEVVRKHWFYNHNLRVHLVFINWKKYIVDAQNTLFDTVGIDTVKGMRRTLTLAMLDVTFYLNPRFSDYMLVNVANDINSEIEKLKNHPSGLFKDSKIALIGYSLGSLILDDLLRENKERLSKIELSQRPKLEHKVDYFFAIGSPLSCYMVYQKPELIKKGLDFPENIRCFNIFHPYDPLAYRWEKLIYHDISKPPKPEILPYWYNNGFKNWYNIDQQLQYCKSLIVDLSDVASSITKGITNWLGSNQNNSVLNQNVSSTLNRKKSFNNFMNKLKKKEETEELEDNQGLKEYEKENNKKEEEQEEELLSDFEIDNSSSNALEKLNINTKLPIRYDYQIQEDATEHFLSPLAILQSHISYWGSRDVSFFILKTVHPKRNKVPITTLLTYVESKAKNLSMETTNENLKKEFIEVSEKAKKILDEISKEEIKYKNESIIVLKSTWNFMTKTADEDDEQPYESLISDHIEHEENNTK